MKDSPKDALIADSTEIRTRGTGFGIARMLDTLGSVAGPLILFGLLFLLKDNPSKYYIVLVATAVSLLITLAISAFKVTETFSRKEQEGSVLSDDALLHDRATTRC